MFKNSLDLVIQRRHTGAGRSLHLATCSYSLIKYHTLMAAIIPSIILARLIKSIDFLMRKFCLIRVDSGDSQTESVVTEVGFCRRLGVNEVTFYRCKKQFACMGGIEVRNCDNWRMRHKLRASVSSLIRD